MLPGHKRTETSLVELRNSQTSVQKLQSKHPQAIGGKVRLGPKINPYTIVGARDIRRGSIERGEKNTKWNQTNLMISQ